MKTYSGIFLFCSLFVVGLPVRAAVAGWELEKVEAGSKYTETKETRNWLGAVSSFKNDWLKLKLSGTFFLKALDEDYEDLSEVEDDAYSRIQATLRFPEAVGGLQVKLGDKWNRKYEIAFYQIGYQWSPWECWTLGARYDGAHRNRLVENANGENNDYHLQQEEISFKYQPESWSYTFKATYGDKDYPNKGAKGDNYSGNRYQINQVLDWQVNSRLDLGLDYSDRETDYRFRGDNSREKWVLRAGYRQDDAWNWDGSYSRTDYSGKNSNYQIDRFNFSGKFNPKGNWWLAGQIGLRDYQYWNYTPNAEELKDPDDDYRSRQERLLSVEFQQKVKPVTYNLEIFVKQYDYQNYESIVYQDETVCGGIATLKCRWGKVDWQLRLAPDGDLVTRKANYELTAAYQF